ncbi:MAG: sigma-70 family RNA polymerase sigma factor [Pseudomonadota bacterium]
MDERSERDSDDDLMLAYAQGDADAFNRLYARYRGPLYRYLMHATGQSAVADDLFQDVWSRIINARLTFQRKTGFKRWAFRIAHNRLVDHWRSNPTRDSNAEHALERLSADARSQPEAERLREERADQLQRALMALPAEQREAFLLQQEAGLSLNEIAGRFGTGRETIKSRLRYAVNKLRQRLGDTSETVKP